MSTNSSLTRLNDVGATGVVINAKDIEKMRYSERMLAKRHIDSGRDSRAYIHIKSKLRPVFPCVVPLNLSFILMTSLHLPLRVTIALYIVSAVRSTGATDC